MFGVICEFDYKNDYFVLNNDEVLIDFVVKFIKGVKILEIIDVVCCEL